MRKTARGHFEVDGRDVTGPVDIAVDIIEPTGGRPGSWAGVFICDKPLAGYMAPTTRMVLENGESADVVWTHVNVTGGAVQFRGSSAPPPSLLG